MDSSKFPAEVVAAAQQVQRETGCPAGATLAQWALESGWGKMIPPGSNNFFGVKALPGYPYVEAPTKEWDAKTKQFIEVTARFRKYSSVADAFYVHGLMLMNPHGPYAAARAYADNSINFVRSIAGKYATDPDYANKLIHIIVEYGLSRFDKPTGR